MKWHNNRHFYLSYHNYKILELCIFNLWNNCNFLSVCWPQGGHSWQPTAKCVDKYLDLPRTRYRPAANRTRHRITPRYANRTPWLLSVSLFICYIFIYCVAPRACSMCYVMCLMGLYPVRQTHPEWIVPVYIYLIKPLCTEFVFFICSLFVSILTQSANKVTWH